MRDTGLLVSVFFAAMLAGCAAAPSVRYAELNKPLAEQGKLKWSDYYRGLYDAALNSTQRDKALVMERASIMIDAALAYERNEIREDQFQSLRRQAQIAQAADEAAQSARTRAALAAAMKSMGDSMKNNAESGYKIVPPAPIGTTNTTCNSFGNQLNCTSHTQ